MTSPFEFVKSINTKQYQDDLSGYNQYIINKQLAMYPDTLFHANEMNIHHDISNRWHYDYLFYGTQKRHRYAEWIKAPKDDELEAIMRYFSMSKQKAREVRSTLTSSEITKIKKKVNDVVG